MFKKLIKTIVEPFPFAAKFFRDLRDLSDRQQPPEITPWGFLLCGDSQMAGGEFEPIETQLVRDFLKDVDVFVNVFFSDQIADELPEYATSISYSGWFGWFDACCSVRNRGGINDFLGGVHAA